MSDHRVPASTCPQCGIANNAATNVADTRAPRPGDISVCLGCATVLVFDAALQLALPTREQRESWSMATLIEIGRARRAIITILNAEGGIG